MEDDESFFSQPTTTARDGSSVRTTGQCNTISGRTSKHRTATRSTEELEYPFSADSMH
jgi:hypothetical protein